MRKCWAAWCRASGREASGFTTAKGRAGAGSTRIRACSGPGKAETGRSMVVISRRRHRIGPRQALRLQVHRMIPPDIPAAPLILDQLRMLVQQLPEKAIELGHIFVYFHTTSPRIGYTPDPC